MTPEQHAAEADRLLAVAKTTSGLAADTAARDRDGLNTQRILRDRVITEHALLAAIAHGLLAHFEPDPEGTTTP